MSSDISSWPNENGIAYGWLMLLTFLVLGAMSWMAIMYVENNVISIANDRIDQSLMSEQTKNAMEFGRSIGMYLPVFMLIGAFLWSALRSIGGSGATYQAFYTGFVIFFLCCITGFMMSFLGGLMIDTLYSRLYDQGMIASTQFMSQEWSDAQDRTMWWFINAYYFLCCFVPIIGAVVYFQSIVRNTFGNRYIR